MLICPLVRFVLALREDGQPPSSRWVAQHLAVCAGCRQHQREVKALVNQLGAAAPRLSRTPPAFLARRVIANLPQCQSSKGFGAWPRRQVWVCGVAALVVALCLGGAFWSGRSTHKQTERPMAALPPAALEIVGDFASGLTPKEAILSVGGKLDEPLQLEWERVMADAQSAARGLAAVFVPEKALDF